jgi:hypothetical protein
VRQIQNNLKKGIARERPEKESDRFPFLAPGGKGIHTRHGRERSAPDESDCSRGRLPERDFGAKHPKLLVLLSVVHRYKET